MQAKNLILSTDVLEDKEQRLAIWMRVLREVKPELSKLELMLAVAEQQQLLVEPSVEQQLAVPVETMFPVPTVKKEQRKEQECKLQRSKKVNAALKTRRITMLLSRARRLCFLSTDVAYYQKDNKSAILHAKSHLKTRKKLEPLLTAFDFKIEVSDKSYRIGKSLDTAKAKAYDKFKSEDWEMLCNRPRVK